ncbi:Cob(I)yrinic acid a,c-diamide adenosyltransferase [compost metagenome]
MGKSKEINAEVLKYLNRLSDYFFAAARNANHRAKVADIEYVRSGKVFGNK